MVSYRNIQIGKMLQDGRLCCTYDVHCPAGSATVTAGARPHSPQALLHSTVSVGADNDNVTAVGFSDTYPTDTTLG